MANPNLSDPKDVELESDITRRIREMGSHIHVTVRGGVASLTGSTDDFETKRSISEIVKGTHGVRKVTNNIKVFPWGSSR